MDKIQHLPFTASQSKWDTISQEAVLFFRYDWHRIWFETIGKEYTPVGLLINDQTIAPFARKEDEVIFSGGFEGTDYIDLVGSAETFTRVWPVALAFLKQQGVTRIHLANIPQTSPTVTFFQTVGAIVTKQETTPRMALPSSWESYVGSLTTKYRHELRRKIRKFEREHEALQIVALPGSEKTANILLQLMRMDPRKAQFLRPEMEDFFRRIITTFSEDILVLILYLESREVSVTLSFIADRSLLLYNSGFDEIYTPGAGFYLKAKGIERAIKDGYQEYNFLQGAERYKYELGGKDFFVYDIQYSL